MPPKEAKARIKINNLLQESEWRLLDNSNGPANVVLENNVKITHPVADEMGEDFEKTTKGYADYLLLDERGFPLIVLEAKSEDKNPLVGKEQAR
jgi:type I restriction enzyme R subunit